MVISKFLKRNITSYLIPLIAVLIVFLIGSINTYVSYRSNLPMGDGATFHTFASNIVKHEVIYKEIGRAHV